MDTDERRLTIGSSDSPAICGVSPFKTALDIWAEKVYGIESKPAEAAQIGLLLEPTLIEKATAELKAKRLFYQKRYIHKSNTLFSATPDAIIRLPGGELAILEAKVTTNPSGWGSEYRGEVPDHVLVQVQHQLFCTELKRAYVVALLAPPLRLWIGEIKANDRLIEAIVERGLEFWFSYVIPRKQPPGALPLEILMQIKRRPEPIPLKPNSDELVAKYLQLGYDISVLEKQREQIKAELLQQLGEFSEGITPKGFRAKIIEYPVQSIDQSKIPEDLYPQIVQQRVCRRLVISKPKEATDEL